MNNVGGVDSASATYAPHTIVGALKQIVSIPAHYRYFLTAISRNIQSKSYTLSSLLGNSKIVLPHQVYSDCVCICTRKAQKYYQLVVFYGCWESCGIFITLSEQICTDWSRLPSQLQWLSMCRECKLLGMGNDVVLKIRSCHRIRKGPTTLIEILGFIKK